MPENAFAPAPTPSSREPEVLIVEDEASIAEPFSRALTRGGFRASVASTGRQALDVLESAPPDVVLLDLRLPDIDGRDLCRQIRRSSDVPIIIITASGSIIDRVVGLELGADDYVVKPFAAGEVMARIRAVLRRAHQSGRERGRRQIGDLRVDPGSRRAWLGDQELDLTRKEFDLLARLSDDAGHVVTREDLMSDVWDVNWFGSTKTLDVHIGALRRKLGEDPIAPRYIRTVRGVGFRLALPDEETPR